MGTSNKSFTDIIIDYNMLRVSKNDMLPIACDISDISNNYQQLKTKLESVQRKSEVQKLVLCCIEIVQMSKQSQYLEYTKDIINQVVDDLNDLVVVI